MFSQLKQKTTLIGFVGADAQTHTIDVDRHVLVFPFAVNDDYKKPNGELIKRSTWFTVQLWYNTNKPVFHTIFNKGIAFILEGKIKAKAYIKEDNPENPLPVNDRIQTELILVLNSFERLPYNKAHNSETTTSVMMPKSN